MSVTLREARAEDAERCGRICYEAFRAINEAHNFPPDIPSPEMGIGVLSMMIAHPGFYVVVAERDGVVLGSNVLDERCEIAGIGPITVDPQLQNAGAGRLLMEHILSRGSKFAGVRLVQAAFHNRSLSLYTKLGFDPREPLCCVTGTPLARQIPGWVVRTATDAELAGCEAVCRRARVPRPRIPRADAQRSAAALVSRAGPAHRAAADADEHGSLPRAARRLAGVDHVLIGRAAQGLVRSVLRSAAKRSSARPLYSARKPACSNAARSGESSAGSPSMRSMRSARRRRSSSSWRSAAAALTNASPLTAGKLSTWRPPRSR